MLELLAEGLTNRRIAKSLFITEKTVRVHVTHILEKLQVNNRGEAGAMARGHGKTPADSEVAAANEPSERGKVRTRRRLTRDLGLRKYRDACVLHENCRVR